MTGHRAIEVISTKFFLDEFLHPDEREALKVAIDCIEKRYFLEEAIEKIKKDIAYYKSDKLVAMERNEMAEIAEIALEIIDKCLKEVDE